MLGKSFYIPNDGCALVIISATLSLSNLTPSDHFSDHRLILREIFIGDMFFLSTGEYKIRPYRMIVGL